MKVKFSCNQRRIRRKYRNFYLGELYQTLTADDVKIKFHRRFCNRHALCKHCVFLVFFYVSFSILYMYMNAPGWIKILQRNEGDNL